eukprot:CAMPEP_0182811506 /NCGR_PEP_ID=MMETSP0006_2-20121128/8307_1 /TAXON_ID=97485 /ORGANISM="Prymnesium parvum, Strain Texoma1" /LENGTH=237 /DNA_ID=CAMNT_0024937469 /DNA_START=18 /DNA_END=731 /DNA_ORIENTATION=+
MADAGVQQQPGDDDDFTWNGDDEDDGSGGGGGDDDQTPRILRDARAWDSFRGLCHAMRPFEQDDLVYRHQRAVEAFNAAGHVMGEYKRLNPQAVSGVRMSPSALFPAKWSSWEIQDGVGQTTLSPMVRRSRTPSIGVACVGARQAAVHHRRNGEGAVVKTWMQKALSVSRIMQTFRDQAVRERVMRDEESVPYLLRQHYKLATTGFSTVGEAAAKDACQDDKLASIFARMSEAREFA